MSKLRTKHLLIILLLLIISCAAAFLIFKSADKKTDFSYLDFYIGKVEIIKQDRKVEFADIKKIISVSDAVKTYENSKAYLQFGNDHLLEINQNTEIAMNMLPLLINSSDGKTEIDLKSGKIFITAGKLTTKGELIIRSSNCTISIRGTIFSVERSGENLTVEVKEGRVEIIPEKSAPVFAEAGEKAIVAGGAIKKEKMSSDNYINFKNISILKPVVNIESYTKQYIIEYFNSVLNSENIQKETGNGETDKKADSQNLKNTNADSNPPKGNRLNVNILTASGIDQKEASDITKIIYSKLVSSKGKDKVIFRSADGKSKSANRQLGGRISKMGSSKIVSVDITDGETGKVLFSQTAKIGADDVPETVLDNLAGQILSTDEIW